jgi:hypothetical protein
VQYYVRFLQSALSGARLCQRSVRRRIRRIEARARRRRGVARRKPAAGRVRGARGEIETRTSPWPRRAHSENFAPSFARRREHTHSEVSSSDVWSRVYRLCWLHGVVLPVRLRILRLVPDRLRRRRASSCPRMPPQSSAGLIRRQRGGVQDGAQDARAAPVAGIPRYSASNRNRRSEFSSQHVCIVDRAVTAVQVRAAIAQDVRDLGIVL